MRQPEWYCDADVRGLGKTLAGMRLPVTWPGDDGERASERLRQPPSPIEDAATADELWIPAVTKAGLVIVTRDSKIMDRVGEINAVIASRARMFVITSHNQLDLWDEVRIVAAQWSTMIKRREGSGPFIDSITLSGTRRLVLATDANEELDGD